MAFRDQPQAYCTSLMRWGPGCGQLLLVLLTITLITPSRFLKVISSCVRARERRVRRIVRRRKYAGVASGRSGDLDALPKALVKAATAQGRVSRSIRAKEEQSRDCVDAEPLRNNSERPPERHCGNSRPNALQRPQFESRLGHQLGMSAKRTFRGLRESKRTSVWLIINQC
jgi:hypothetical protein